MKNTTFLPTRPATPEDLLAVFRDQYRFQLQLDHEAEPDYEIEFGLTVHDWTNACDLIRPSGLGPALGQEFGVEATRDDWLRVLEPYKKRTLRDVCDFISAHGGHVAATGTVRIFGRECGGAGAFLAIRSLLKKHDVDVTGLRPSSSINAFIKNTKQHSALLNALCHLAPGILPDVEERADNNILTRGLAVAFPLGYVLMLAGFLVAAARWLSGYLGGPDFAVVYVKLTLATGGVLTLVALIGLVICVRIWPTEHSHPPVETFGDLARAVATYEPPASSE